jgi:hypothetical protein
MPDFVPEPVTRPAPDPDPKQVAQDIDAAIGVWAFDELINDPNALHVAGVSRLAVEDPTAIEGGEQMYDPECWPFVVIDQATGQRYEVDLMPSVRPLPDPATQLAQHQADLERHRAVFAAETPVRARAVEGS